MRVITFDKDGFKTQDSPDLPALLAVEGQGVWVDMVGPDHDDLRVMREVFKFHPLTIEDTTNRRQRPKVEEYGEFLFSIFNPLEKKGNDIEFRELDVFLGQNFIVTVHQQFEPLIDLALHSCTNRANYGETISGGYILYVLVDMIVDSYFPALDALEDDLDKMSDQVVTNPNHKYLQRMFEIKRMLAEFTRVVGNQRDMFHVITRDNSHRLQSGSLEYYFRDVYDHLLRTNDLINTIRDTLMGVVDLYFSAQSNKLNIVVQRLTFVTIAIGIFTVISGFYGMNFLHTFPPFSSEWGVPFVLVLMGIAALVIIYFRKRSEED
jgi:magnesium transporter